MYTSYKEKENDNTLLVPSFCSEGLRKITIKARLKEFREFGERRIIDIRLEASSHRLESGKYLMSAIDLQVKKTGTVFSNVAYQLDGNNRTKGIMREEEEKSYQFPNYESDFEFTEKIYFYPTYYLYKSELSKSQYRFFYGELEDQDRDGFYDSIRISGDHLQILSVQTKTGGKLNDPLLHPSGSPFVKAATYSLDHDKIRKGDKVMILDRNFRADLRSMWELTLQGSIKPDR